MLPDRVNASPKKDRCEVSRLSVVPSPAEPLGVHGEVLCHCQDGEGQALEESGQVILLHLVRTDPVEPLVEVDVFRLVVNLKRKYFQVLILVFPKNDLFFYFLSD